MELYRIIDLQKRTEEMIEEVGASCDFSGSLKEEFSEDLRTRFFELIADSVPVVAEWDDVSSALEDKKSWGRPTIDEDDEGDEDLCINSFGGDLGFDSIAGFTKEGVIRWFRTKFEGGVSEAYTMLESLSEVLEKYKDHLETGS